MKLIKNITDMDIIGKGGLSAAKPRITARAILKNRNNQYALIHTDGFNIYSFIGGGADDGEDILSALKREVAEETGCTCDEITALGYITENRNHCNYVQHNYYHVVTTDSQILNPSFTADELKHNTSVDWFCLEQVIELIKNNVTDTVQKKFLVARDIAALDYYINEVGI